MIAPLIDSFLRWTAYPDQKQDEERYNRAWQRIKSEKTESSQNR
jgi:hypothetical protein